VIWCRRNVPLIGAVTFTAIASQSTAQVDDLLVRHRTPALGGKPGADL
jgi:hypothetical protein